MERFLWISLGAILGANLRYWVADAITRRLSTTFPYGTLFINLSGSFLIGLLYTLGAAKFNLDPRIKLFFGVGLLGAYTTFSTYMLESATLIGDGKWLTAFGNIIVSSLLGLAAIGLGIWLGRSL